MQTETPQTESPSETPGPETGVVEDGSAGFSLLKEPLVIEGLTVLALFLLSALFFRKLAAVAKEVGRRKNLREFIDGMDAAFKKDYPRAIRLLSSVVEKDPENAEARICLGDAHRETGNAAEARKHHYHVLEIFGRDLLQNHLSLARDLIALDRLPEAKDHLSRVLDERPRHVQALRLMAEVNERMGTFSAAVKMRRTLLEETTLEKERSVERRALARALALAGSQRLDDGDLKRGVPLLEEAVKISPGLVRPRMEMVRAKIIEGNAKGARKVFRQQFKDMKSLMETEEFVFEPSVVGTVGSGTARGGLEVTEAVDRIRGEDGAPRIAEPTAARIVAPEEEGETRNDTEEPGPGNGTPAPVSPAVRPAVSREESDLLPPDLESVGEFLHEMLEREAPYHCTACGRSSARFEEQCSECSAWGTMIESDRTYLRSAKRLGEIFDEIDENEAYLDRLVKRLGDRDGSAAEKLLRAGEHGCLAVLRGYRSARHPRALVDFLISLGVDGLPRVAWAHGELLRRTEGGSEGVTGTLLKIADKAVSVPGTIVEETGWLGNKGGKKSRASGDTATRALDAVVAEVFLGVGPAGLPFHRRNLEESSGGVQRASLIAVLHFGAEDLLEELPLAVPKTLVMDVLNDLSDEVTRDLLRRVRPEGQFAQQILTDRTFQKANLLVTELKDPSCAATVTDILGKRGFSPEVFKALGSFEDNGIPAPRVREILASFGPEASDHLVAAVADVLTSPTFAGISAEALRALGAGCVERLTEHLDGRDTPQEARLMELIASYGEDAVEPLLDQYAKAGKVGLLGRGKGRGQVRKSCILDLLERIGGKRVKKALKPLLKKESDETLKRKIEQVTASVGRRG